MISNRNAALIGVGSFVAGTWCQLAWDKWNTKRKLPQILDRHLPDAAKVRAAQIHNLHVDNSQRLVEGLADIWVEFLDTGDTELLAERNKELQAYHAEQLEFIKQICVG